MELIQAMQKRHSVRQYLQTPINPEIADALRAEMDACNREGDLHIQLAVNEPKAFGGLMARYGKFLGVTNYIALIGKKDADLQERCGYYGERLVLKAQQLGLNSCWVALTYKKIPSVFDIAGGEKLIAVIAVGYGKTQGVPHKSKSVKEVSNMDDSVPDWFCSGVNAALLAPTAMNQQKFTLTYADGMVAAKAGTGPYAKLDLGIVKYHFELGAGKENVLWVSGKRK